MRPESTRPPLRIGVVTEPLVKQPLTEVMDWLLRAAPEITDLEIGAGGYAPPGHCDTPLMLRDASARAAWSREIETRGLRIGALNAWGNPLHPDPAVAALHDTGLRDTVRLAAAIGVDRVVALAGCPAGSPGDSTPHFAGGGWLPYLESIHQRQWDRVRAYWRELGEFVQSCSPALRVCLELHPGTVAYNVESFEQLAAVHPAVAANVDPSHFFWMGMDANKVSRRIAGRIGHAHAKDVVFQDEHLALNGLLDRRWPSQPDKMPWNFATVGRGHDLDWWRAFLAELSAAEGMNVIAIEHEDPFVPPEVGIVEAARLLRAAMSSSEGR